MGCGSYNSCDRSSCSDDERAEAEWVADEIEILIDSGRTAQEIAIIYHENRYASLLEEAISRAAYDV